MRGRGGAIVSFLLFVIVVAGGCASAGVPQQRPEDAELVFLEFDSEGYLSNHGEVATWIDAARPRFAERAARTRVVLLSLGWNYSPDAMRAQYVSLFREYRAWQATGIRPPTPPGGDAAPPRDTVVLCVVWNSRGPSFEPLIDPVVPFPPLSGAISGTLDAPLFPVSFWSRASLADRIGAVGLPLALRAIARGLGVDPDTGELPLYAMGHSFGCRVLAGLFRRIDEGERASELGDGAWKWCRVGLRPAGALLVQPAASLNRLDDPRDPPYPVVITQTEHDHANGFAYPVASFLLNPDVGEFARYSFVGGAFTPRNLWDREEAVAEAHRVYAEERRADAEAAHRRRSAGGYGEAAQRQEPSPDAPPEPPPTEIALRVRTGSPGRLFEFGIDFSNVYGIVGSGVADAIVATCNQVGVLAYEDRDEYWDHGAQGPVEPEGIAKWGWARWAADTLAQVPVAEVLPETVGAALFPRAHFGRRRRGLLEAGPGVDSAGRITSPAVQRLRDVLIPRNAPRVLPLPTDWTERQDAARNVEWLTRRGLRMVDASDFIRESDVFGFRYRMDRWWWRYTISWFDPIGAHGDYRRPEVFALIDLVLRLPERAEPPGEVEEPRP